MLTDEQKAQIKADYIEAIEEAKTELKNKEVVDRFPATHDPNVEITSEPEERLITDPKGGFKSFGHFLTDLIKVEDKNATVRPEALTRWYQANKAAGTMEEGIPSQGGYTVPTQYGEMIYQQSLEGAVVRPRARYQPMMSNRIEIVADVDKNHSANYYGGVYIYHTAEGSVLNASNPTYETIALTLHKVTGLCHVTNELLEDSAIAVEADVTRKFADAIQFVMDDDFLNGTGASEPLGVLNSGNPALITVTAVGGQGASTFIAENVRDMYYRLYPAGRNNAVWLANPDVFPQLFGMVLTVGTAGIPVWLPAGGVSGAPYESLMGRPIIYTEKCQTLGTAGDIAFVDLSRYIVAGKANGNAPSVATSIHLKFDYDQQSFRFTMRYDGQPSWTSPMTPLYSSTTLSPFVVLSGTRT